MSKSKSFKVILNNETTIFASKWKMIWFLIKTTIKPGDRMWIFYTKKGVKVNPLEEP